MSDKLGNIYFSARFAGFASFAGQLFGSRGGKDLLLVKMDKDGNTLWARTFGSRGDDFGMNNLAVDMDNNLCMSAMFRLDNDTVQIGSQRFMGSTQDDIFVMKLNGAGDVLWANKEGGRFHDGSYGIATDAQGNIYNTGWFADVANFGGVTYTAQQGASKGRMFISKYNSDGKLQYVKTPLSGLGSTGHDVTVSKDGSIYVSGQTYETLILGSNVINTNIQTAFVAKYTADGEIAWLIMPDTGKPSTSLKSVTDNNGDVYTAINTYGKTSVVKHSAEGKLLWTNAAAPHTTPLHVESICSNIYNDIFISGTYGNDNRIMGKMILPIYQKATNNCYIASVSSNAANVPDMGIADDNEFSISPNPNKGSFTINGIKGNEYKRYEIINTIGRLVNSGVLDVQMTVEDLQPGIYIIRLISDNSSKALKFAVE